MIKVQLRDLLHGVQSLARFGQRDLPANLSFKVARVIRGANDELKQYEESRKDTCEKFGTLKEDGSAYDIPDEKMDDFNREIEALLDEEVEIPGALIKPAALGETRVPPAELAALYWLFVPEDDTAETAAA